MRSFQFDFPTNTSHSFIHLANNVYYKLHILYDVSTDSYYMNVDKFIDGNFVNIINAIKLTVGLNLFLQYSYLNLGNFFIIPYSDKYYYYDPSAASIKDNYFIIWEHE